MSFLRTKIEEVLFAAIAHTIEVDQDDFDLMIRTTNNLSHGDYQANFAMKLGKDLGENPRALAQKVVDSISSPGFFSKIEVAGPGFINMTLSDEVVNAALQHMVQNDSLGVEIPNPQTVVVDYSSPNVAKEMHIGHLRSTIIGDSIVRVLRFMGHNVICQNHIGDWGTQFGMLIEYLIDMGYSPETEWEIKSLDEFYQSAKKRFDADSDFKVRAKERVVKLQHKDEGTIYFWEKLCSESYKHFSEIYDRLNVLLTKEDIAGESKYNDDLTVTLGELEVLGLVVDSDGAKVIYPDGFVGKDGTPLGMIVQKSDGAFLYATTDLSAAKYRITHLSADRIVYVTDSRQSLHFEMLFEVLKSSGWASSDIRLQHVPFGTILGKDNRPFKTREGGTVKLVNVLNACVKHAEVTVRNKSAGLSEEQCKEIANIVGMGALKYSDLSSDRIKDYVFDIDRMLSLDGNTAPYIQYSYARICSILRKLEQNGVNVSYGQKEFIQFVAENDVERNLALKLLQFSSILESVSDSLEPHRLAGYLYEISALFHSFYERCSVVNAGSDGLRDSRIMLLELLQNVLVVGLDLLGIEVVDDM